VPDDRTALLEAVTAGDVPALSALLEREPELAAARDDQGRSAVLLALYHRQDATREALLAADPPLDACEAAALGRLDLLRDHLAADPDATGARSSEGFAPLHLAAFFGGADAVRLLLAAGADPNADDDNALGVRPLHSAAAVSDHGAVRALLDAGADPDARQRGGFTALHAAAHSDDAELASLLLDHGADPSLVTDEGADAAALAGPRVRALLAQG
jgi:ankyrin repeat protein